MPRIEDKSRKMSKELLSSLNDIKHFMKNPPQTPEDIKAIDVAFNSFLMFVDKMDDKLYRQQKIIYQLQKKVKEKDVK